MVWIQIGSVFLFLAVAFGAFGAHALKARLSPDMLVIFETGVRYQFYHALGLLFVGLLQLTRPSSSLMMAGSAFVAGILVFSGSLYILSLTGVRWWGAITPLGGLSFLVGWALLFWSTFK